MVAAVAGRVPRKLAHTDINTPRETQVIELYEMYVSLENMRSRVALLFSANKEKKSWGEKRIRCIEHPHKIVDSVMLCMAMEMEHVGRDASANVFNCVRFPSHYETGC